MNFVILLLIIASSIETKKPRIGVLSLTPTKLVQTYVQEGDYLSKINSMPRSEIPSIVDRATYIDVNYINYIKLGGMEPVPLLLDDSEEETLAQLETLNGVLLTGGAERMYSTMEFQSDTATHYQRRVRFLLEQAKRINDSGRYFILYAICLGYESLLSAENDNKNMLRIVDHQVKAYKSNTLIKGAKDTKFGRYLKKHLYLLEKPINYFYHKYGVLLEDFYQNEKLTDKMRPFSYIPLDNGFNVLTGVEYKDYPIYLVLFHPEKIKHVENFSLEVKRIYLKRQLARFIKNQIRKAGTTLFDGSRKLPVLRLKFSKSYGSLDFYTKRDIIPIV